MRARCEPAPTSACRQKQTVALVDPAAKVEVDLQTKLVKIDSAEDRSDFAEALSEAGYPPAK